MKGVLRDDIPDGVEVIDFFEQVVRSAGLGTRDPTVRGVDLDLTPEDELKTGILTLRLNEVGSQVHILFGEPVATVGMTPEQALQMARKLRISARKVLRRMTHEDRRNRGRKRARRRAARVKKALRRK